MRSRLEPRDRLLAPAAVKNPVGEVVGANLGAIVRRLVLFPEVILDSYAMRELPALIEALGPEGFIALLESGALAIRADGWTFGEIGNGGLVPGYGPAPLPLLDYALAPLVPHDREHHIHLCLGEIREMTSLATKMSKKVRSAIVSALVEFPEHPGRDSTEALLRDLTLNEGLLRAAIAESASQRLGRDLCTAAYAVRVEQIDENVLRAQTDLGRQIGLTAEQTDKVLESAMLAIARVNQRLEEMKAYDAVSGYREGELSLVEDKLQFVLNQVDPGRQEERFARIITITGLPDPETAEGTVNVERLLEIRESEQCRAFRQWLRTLDQATDEEIREQVESIREQVSRAVHGGAGKIVRLATTTGVGMVPVIGPIASLGLSAIEQFALEKLVPEPGPVSFLSSSYPSIFNND